MEEIMPTLNIKGFPEDLYEVLGERAKRDHRSLTGEVIYLLEWALKASEKDEHSILRLRGLGKNLWKDVDAAEHIEAERNSWE